MQISSPLLVLLQQPFSLFGHLFQTSSALSLPLLHGSFVVLAGLEPLDQFEFLGAVSVTGSESGFKLGLFVLKLVHLGGM